MKHLFDANLFSENLQKNTMQLCYNENVRVCRAEGCGIFVLKNELGGEKIYKSCKYCGRIHDECFKCPKKPQKYEKQTEPNILRSSYKWSKVREKVRKRDIYLCQICLRTGRYNYDSVEVHHAVKIADNIELAFETNNLITLCKEHHKMADYGEITYEIIKKIIDEQEKLTPPGI